MASLAVVAAAMFLIAIVLLTWHARAQAVREARRLAAEAARGRELESVAMEAASLLAATLQSLHIARRAARETRIRATVDDAAAAASALSSLFSAVRLYLKEDDVVVDGPVDGSVRLAVAIARSRGCGIAVRGEKTGLTFRGRAKAACALVTTLLDQCRDTLRDGESVEVRLEETSVTILGGTRRRLEPSREDGCELGWTIEQTPGSRAGVRLCAAFPEDTAPDGRLHPSGEVLH